MSLLDPESSSISGEQCLALLKETLVRQDIRVGEPLKTGHEACASGIMAYAVYKHIGGQREYWLLPHEESSVFACWEMGAISTAGMERHDIHEMLQKLHFESMVEDEPEAEVASNLGEAGGVFEIADIEAEMEASQEN